MPSRSIEGGVERTFLRLALVVSVSVFATSCEPGLSSFDRTVNSLIRNQCNFESPCRVRLSDATTFDWDEMYVFRPGILDGEAQQIVPAVEGFQREFNRKIAFLKDGKLVRIDEAPSIIEGEHTPPGMLFFKIDESGNPDCLRYSSDVEFEVQKERWIRGDVYMLKCTNCVMSPIFAEFGTAK